MKKSEVQVGSHYLAKVSGKLVTVRVDAIREVDPLGSLTNRYGRVKPPVTVYDVTSLSTWRKMTFRSAAKFRQFVPPDGMERAKSPSSLFQF